MKQNIGFIGAGNMCQTLIQGWVAKSLIVPENIFVSNRTPGKVNKLAEQLKINACATNEEVIDKSEVVVVAVKPQDLVAAIEPLGSSFGPEHMVISLAAGIPLARLKKLAPQVSTWVRLMANTPARIQRGVFGYCSSSSVRVDNWMEAMMAPLGLTVRLEEGEEFEAFSVATSAGVGFVFELMIYWQEWLEERGIEADLAQQMTIQTFLGASELAAQSTPQTLEGLQSKVTSKKGITAAGLDSMRELEIERLLRYSFEKAALRDRELGQ